MGATRIIAVRHGETAWNVDTRIQGHLDIPLNDTGLWQARQLARALADEPVAAIYTSDLQRARATAQAVADTTGAPLTPEPDLRERSFGHFQGRTFAQIEAELPEDALRWRKRDPHYAPEGGESLTALREPLEQLVARLQAVTIGLLTDLAQGKVNSSLANSALYLKVFGHTVIGWRWLEQAIRAEEGLAKGNAADVSFYKGKLQAARYFLTWEVPACHHELAILEARDDVCLGMQDEWF